MNTFSRFSSTSHTPSPANVASTDAEALEINLLDGLDRLEDFAIMMAFQSTAVPFEILAVAPASETQQQPSRRLEASVNTDKKIVSIQSTVIKKTA